MNKSRMKAMIIVIILAIVLTGGVIVGSRTLLPPQEDKTVAIVLKSEPSSEFWKEVFAGSQKGGLVIAM